jgi:hypothetical protein
LIKDHPNNEKGMLRLNLKDMPKEIMVLKVKLYGTLKEELYMVKFIIKKQALKLLVLHQRPL